MCGICGALSFTDDPVDAGAVRSMLGAMAHRGPDSEGVLERPGIVAGIRRLAVIDLEGGAQPMANEDGSVEVVVNGEIYNYRELRDELISRGHVLRTRSDTEVLVHLWEDHGPAMLQRLNGMFALCVHDARTGETFLARDRLGIKPLYYRLDGAGLVFASELGVLLQHDAVEAEIDPVALAESFRLQFVSGDRTVYRDVLELLPGHTIRVRDGRVAVERWYEIPSPQPGELTERAAIEELHELLESSVRYRMISDVPLGLFLSGGLDSTALLQVAAGRTGRPVQTFSVGFDDAEAFDEREHARVAAARFGAEHHELVLSPLDIPESLPRLVRHLASPVVDPALIPTYLLSRFARESVTVVLTGEGADELLGGYRRYRYQSQYGWVGRVPGARLAVGAGVLPRRLAQAVDAAGRHDPTESHLAWAATIGRDAMRGLFRPDVVQALDRRAQAAFAPYFETDGFELGPRLRADQHEWLPHNLLAKVDRASMAFSLEARVPFLDHRIVEWAARLPDSLKIRGKSTKHILRSAFRERLPASILERPKRGFDLPLDDWIRGPLRETARDLVEGDGIERWPGLEPDAARAMLRGHLDGRESYGLPLFNMVSVMLFLESRR
ncbi:MAG: asparagine synthase (glutamine-hydrolyzing) [bacterium]|nr:asparagine synthase (glutamine-hydrolyzing) [bacterium]